MTTAGTTVSVSELGGQLLTEPLGVDEAGNPTMPVIFVDLAGSSDDGVDSARAVVAASDRLFVGMSPGPPADRVGPLVDALTCTLTSAETGLPRSLVGVADLAAAQAAIVRTVGAAPRAAMTFGGLLRVTAGLPVREGLVAESLAYSMLLAGAEFAGWRVAHPRRPLAVDPSPAVLLERSGPVLQVRINRSARHNALSREVRDGLVDAFDLALLDDSIATVQLDGAGASFCSGGDLDEFGSGTDPATAHLIRLDRSVAARVERCRDRVQVVVHGACIGAGIEIPSFAGRISAREDAFFQLPELALGLVPGAGGTVGLPRRIGRWRTAYLGLSGTLVDVDTALDWGLVDGHDDGH